MSFLNYFHRREKTLFRDAVILSILLHFLLWGTFHLGRFFSGLGSDHTLEIDLTKPFKIGGNPFLKPGGGTSLIPPKEPGIPKALEKASAQEEQKPSPPKDWVLPGPETKELEKPVPEKVSETKGVPGGIPEGTGDGYQGTGGGWGGGDGEGGGIPLSRFPKLLNRKEILRLLRRNYPLAERQAGIESVVVVDLHLDTSGSVTGVDVVGSGGASFDDVAQMVANKMRFSPALVGKDAVAVKIRQSITFKLEE